MRPIEISKLPDGRFVLATQPQRALSEDELRRELSRRIDRPDIVEDLIARAKRIRELVAEPGQSFW